MFFSYKRFLCLKKIFFLIPFVFFALGLFLYEPISSIIFSSENNAISYIVDPISDGVYFILSFFLLGVVFTLCILYFDYKNRVTSASVLAITTVVAMTVWVFLLKNRIDALDSQVVSIIPKGIDYFVVGKVEPYSIAIFSSAMLIVVSIVLDFSGLSPRKNHVFEGFGFLNLVKTLAFPVLFFMFGFFAFDMALDTTIPNKFTSTFDLFFNRNIEVLVFSGYLAVFGLFFGNRVRHFIYRKTNREKLILTVVLFGMLTMLATIGVFFLKNKAEEMLDQALVLSEFSLPESLSVIVLYSHSLHFYSIGIFLCVVWILLPRVLIIFNFRTKQKGTSRTFSLCPNHRCD